MYLATAHRNHDTPDNSAANLAARCQRCHMLHVRPEHLRGERSGICSGVSTRRANKKGSDKGAFVLWRLCSLYYLQQVRPLS